MESIELLLNGSPVLSVLLELVFHSGVGGERKGDFLVLLKTVIKPNCIFFQLMDGSSELARWSQSVLGPEEFLLSSATIALLF